MMMLLLLIDCGGGTQTRTRTVTTQRVGTGTACPALTGSQSCNTAACSSGLSTHGTRLSLSSSSYKRLHIIHV
jgi:N-acetylglucosamine kinase-like BadF-type ATPase